MQPFHQWSNVEMEKLTKDLQELQISEKDDNKTVLYKFNEILKKLNEEGYDEKTFIAEQVVKDGILQNVIGLLQQPDVSPNIQSKSAELIAELAKNDLARKLCTELPLIPLLINLLHQKGIQVPLQGCRALGNICYDNNEGRSLMNANKGTEAAIHLIKTHLEGEEASSLRTFATGYLFNLTNTYEATQMKVLEADLISLFCRYLEQYPQEEDLCMHILLILNCIIDTELGRQKFLETNMCQTLIKLLDLEVTNEVVETILELLNNLVQCIESVKFQLATSDLCSVVSKLIKKHQGQAEDESVEIVKAASELVILLLTADDSMVHLYSDGNGMLYTDATSWLESTEEPLQIAGALAIGNFATKDEHCIQMVAAGVANKLIAILKQQCGREGDIRLQHAVLGALRNLAIPVVNKSAMVANGVVDAILPMIGIETYPVVFKLLGTLRMLIDKQDTVAKMLGVNEEFLRQLVTWCCTEDHPGIQGEANRLLAWLVKNSKSVQVMQKILVNGGLPFIVKMSISEHAVMQTESLIALTLIATSILDEAETDFRNTGLVDNLKKVLTSSDVEAEVKNNALVLIAALFKSDKLTESLKESEIQSSIKNLASGPDSPLTQQAKLTEMMFQNP